MKPLEPYWRPAMAAGKLKFAKASHRDFVEKGAGLGLERYLVAFLRNKSPSNNEIAEIQAHMLATGTDNEVRIIVNALSKSEGLGSKAATIAMLQTLQQMATAKSPKSLQRSFRGLKKLISDDNESIAVLAASNLGAWRVAGKEELAALEDSSHNAALKRELAFALATTSGPRYGKTLAQLATTGDLNTRYAAVVLLADADLNRSIELTARLLTEDPSTADPAAVVEAILGRRQGGRLLSEALQDVELHPTVLARVSEFHRDTGLLPGALADKFQSPKQSGSLSVDLLAEDQTKLIEDVEKLGDPARGEIIYRRKEVSCTKCHAVGSAGPEIGPNLVAVGGAAKTSYLVQSILQPNAAIAEHYENKTFVLVTGKVQTGIVTFRNDKEVVVRDSAQLGRPFVEKGFSKNRANFYGMLVNIDENMGRLEAFLKKERLRENTLVIFMTDNGTAGPCKEGEDHTAGLRGLKGSTYEGGQRASGVGIECAEEAESCIRVMGKLKTTKGEAAESTIPKVLKGNLRHLSIIGFNLGDSKETLAAPDVDAGNT